MDRLPGEAHIEVPASSAASFAGELSAARVDYERAGAARGIAEAVELFIVAVPSLSGLALVLEKLRRARLPRTFVVVRKDRIDTWTDSENNDGRLFVSTESDEFFELPDTTISVEILRHALGRGRESDS
jgi:hypothetical protein